MKRPGGTRRAWDQHVIAYLGGDTGLHHVDVDKAIVDGLAAEIEITQGAGRIAMTEQLTNAN